MDQHNLHLLLQAHQAGYQQLQKEMAQRILNGTTNSDSSSNEQRVWKETDMPYLSVLDVNRVRAHLTALFCYPMIVLNSICYYSQPVEPIMPISLQRYNLKMMTAVKPANRW